MKSARARAVTACEGGGVVSDRKQAYVKGRLSRETARVAPGLRDSWTAEAACQGQPREWFFPEGWASESRALEVCPAIATCGAWALANGEEHGVWGGQVSRDRAAEIRATRLAQRAADSFDELARDVT